jgi:hypothetical protein
MQFRRRTCNTLARMNGRIDLPDTHPLLRVLLRELDEISVADRVRQATDLRVQERIDAELIRRVGSCVDAPDHILAARIDELEQEWSIERTLTLQSSATALLGLMLGASADRRWHLLTLVTSGFLMQHAIQGWCPPLALHRRRGVRTRREIDLELHMIKLLRGDFASLAQPAMAIAPGAV